MDLLKAGIVGCGAIFPMHAVSIAQSGAAKLVAVCDTKPERAIQASKDYGCSWHTDLEGMLEREKLDVLHICTPHYLHPPQTLLAANRNVHVLTEKPMSITSADGRSMIEACERNGTKLGVIFQNRYNPGALLIREALDDGSLGDVLGARASVLWTRSDEYYASSDWRGTWAKEGGGVLINQSIHTLDLLRWYMDSTVTQVEAKLSNRTHTGIEVEDTAEGALTFQNGKRALFYVTTSYSYDAPVEVELHCERGIAKLTADQAVITYRDGTTISRDRQPQEAVSYGGGVKTYWGVSHSKQIRDYYRSLLRGEAPAIDGREALKTQTMIEAIYQSGRTGLPVIL
ncbi:Gfo/Idh/MocA family protein [Gorillibacterium timonense]|uniref:Gfo/Idh/MocA family protein n=1 Tax=Gorillibacterium timonense TaxID=1689269 RepID=UPI00071E1628|nr:Gfo/Idh/MocA family oxidoreductase [Gorillibacterium timonense]